MMMKISESKRGVAWIRSLALAGVLLLTVVLRCSPAFAADTCFKPFTTLPNSIETAIFTAPPGMPSTTGAQQGFVMGGSGGGSVTCTMPAGFDRIAYVGGNNLASGAYEKVKIAPGVMEIKWPPGSLYSQELDDYNHTTQSIRLVSGGASISCSGGGGTHSASYPDEAQAWLGSADFVSVPCANGPDGTVTISYSVSPQTIQVGSNGMSFNYDLYTFLIGGGGIVAYPRLSFFATNGGIVLMETGSTIPPQGPLSQLGSFVKYISIAATEGVRSVPAFIGMGLQACDVSFTSGVGADGRLDFGTVDAPAQPRIGDALGNKALVTVQALCNQIAAGGKTPGTHYFGLIRGNSDVSSATNVLASDNPSVGFAILDKDNNPLPLNYPAPATGAYSSVDDRLTLEWTFQVQPSVTSLPLRPGKTTAVSYVDLWAVQ